VFAESDKKAVPRLCEASEMKTGTITPKGRCIFCDSLTDWSVGFKQKPVCDLCLTDLYDQMERARRKWSKTVRCVRAIGRLKPKRTLRAIGAVKPKKILRATDILKPIKVLRANTLVTPSTHVRPNPYLHTHIHMYIYLHL